MSGLEALSLACNILQLIDAAGQTILFCKKVYDGATPDAHLMTTASTLKALSDEIYKDSTIVQTIPSRRRLYELAKRCNEAARALEEETKFLSGHQAKGSLRATLALAAKSNWRKKRLERLDKELQAHQRLLDLQILANVCTQGEAIKAQQASDFAKLDHALQQIVAGIATGQKSQSELIRAQAQGISMHVTQEANRLTQAVEVTVAHAQGALESHITESISTLKITHEDGWRQAVTQDQQQRLLRSLKFPGMYARQNMLKEPAKDTYQWIFGGGNVDEDAESELSQTSNDSLKRATSDSLSQTSSESDTTSESNAEPDKPWDDFNEWLQSDSQLYWISGKPGSGKSTLMKFLAHHPKTIESLSTWQQSCQVITYYFWKPGSSLQHSLRDLRFTLLHQLLSRNEALLGRLFAQFRSYDEPEDWAVSSLDQALFDTLASQSASVCIFLDGLDEICVEDGPAQVLHFVPRLLSLSNVKVCASSRPEWAFESRFGKEQHLRLQDLTFQDMRITSRLALGPYQRQGPEQNIHMLDFLIDSVCWKAEGVFLWLELALRDLITGFINEDSYDELRERLNHLPRELADLYWDMWNRLNSGSSSELYRQIAAGILSAVLKFRDSSQLERDSLTLLELQLMTQPGSLAHDGLATNLTCDELQLVDWQRVDRDVYIRSGGLLQTWAGKDFAHFPSYTMASTPPSKMRIFKVVGFIHRSAFDFLTETTNGRMILSYNTLDLDSERVRFIIARLALVHFNIGYLAAMFDDVDDGKRQMYSYESSIDLATSSPQSRVFTQKAIGSHIRFLEAHKHLGVEQEVYIAYLARRGDKTRLGVILADLNEKLDESEQRRIANRIQEILCFERPYHPAEWVGRAAVAIARLRTLGADPDHLMQPPVNVGTFTIGLNRPPRVSARIMGISFAFLFDALPLGMAGTFWPVPSYTSTILNISIAGINILDLQWRTYLRLPPEDNGLDETHLFWTGNPFDDGTNLYPTQPQPMLLVEVNIAFMLHALISQTGPPYPSEWEAVLCQCRPYLQVRCYSKVIYDPDSVSTGWRHQFWGQIDDATSYELSDVLMALFTMHGHDDPSTLLEAKDRLMFQVEASEADEERCGFRDPEHLRLSQFSSICKALGLDEEEYFEYWRASKRQR